MNGITHREIAEELYAIGDDLTQWLTDNCPEHLSWETFAPDIDHIRFKTISLADDIRAADPIPWVPA